MNDYEKVKEFIEKRIQSLEELKESFREDYWPVRMINLILMRKMSSMS